MRIEKKVTQTLALDVRVRAPLENPSTVDYREPTDEELPLIAHAMINRMSAEQYADMIFARDDDHEKKNDDEEHNPFMPLGEKKLREVQRERERAEAVSRAEKAEAERDEARAAAASIGDCHEALDEAQVQGDGILERVQWVLAELQRANLRAEKAEEESAAWQCLLERSEKERKEAVADWGEKTKELRDALARLGESSARGKSLERDLNNARIRITELERDHKSSNNNALRATEERNKARNERNQACNERDRLERSLVDAHDALDTAKANVDRLSASETNARYELGLIKEAIDHCHRLGLGCDEPPVTASDYAARIMTMGHEQKVLKEQIKELQLTRLSVESGRINEEQLQGMKEEGRTDIEKVVAERDQARRERNNWQAKAKMAIRERDEAREVIDRIVRERDKARYEHDKSRRERADWRGAHDLMAQKLKGLESERDEASASCARWRDRAASLERDHDALQKNVKQLASQRAAAITERDVARNALKEAREDGDRARSRIASLEQQLKDATLNRDEACASAARWSDQAASLERDVNQLTYQRDKYRELREKLEKDLEPMLEAHQALSIAGVPSDDLTFLERVWAVIKERDQAHKERRIALGTLLKREKESAALTRSNEYILKQFDEAHKQLTAAGVPQYTESIDSSLPLVDRIGLLIQDRDEARGVARTDLGGPEAKR